ncbi:MAG: hypothetical protein COW24_05365 [Candidatus Kerfeldbacteria bacterium CG15_BIG_FIL_POST_REV_8_21_14_020_45_12]|uniref:Type 4 fimbrial biogenesis protein PilX N-terminal domain-containing protein n=1 Tax=Candidatus Kerfeldbacteria bacterium CG15_BIG_FIL_POST_REV_8_21_14_020_45_12 TaxID=2014247 RepID=A0A2M7H2N8_9BACT|nr:MAG: hypothetical protein COW24_05365 [Candidatus Kerfeldbacteria bacterium CG15_BIG_FIL_POST_REV_8_21_14_020_45_12]PJA93492.1 MAG: hypothetical protein CO132_02580 [Candidatus Kerfeldbacteria bacterium CG_4_9_14_3_um_filter_45_8]
MFDNNREQRGSILLFSLVTLTILSTAAFVMASLILRETKLARTVDNALQTWYGAETGVERSLDVITEGRKTAATFSGTVTEVENMATSSAPYVMPNSGAEYYIDASKTTSTLNALTVALSEFPGVQIELYNPDSTFALMSAESMQVLWNDPQCGGSSRIEVTYQEFIGTSFGLADDTVRKDIYTCGVESPPVGWDCQATSNTPAPNTNYVVRVRGLDCTILGANIMFYDADNGAAGGGAEVGIPSQAFVTVVGSGLQTERSFSYRSKWLPSASGLGDFALFSASQIVK